MRLLENCQWISSNVGTPVQRMVFYFSEALRERINNEKGCSNDKSQHFDACIKRDVNAFSAMHQKLPFFQVIHLTAGQTILENINNEAIIHLIDFNILTGLHWAAFMQAFSEQKRDQNSYLKITAIETEDKTRAEKTGNLLKTFASNLNLSLTYNSIFLSDIKDFKQDDLGIEPEEDVAVLFPFMLRSLISKPICLKNLMTITEKIKPSIIVVTEIEANLNSPSFFTRFIDTLFYYGALFDSLEESMAGDDKNRMVIEAGTYRKGIHNIVAMEGYKRLSRSVTINVWRAFFTRFGMQELEISPDSLHQACLIVNQFPSGKSCTLDVSTKCLIIGWKGTPLFSLSAQKLSTEQILKLAGERFVQFSSQESMLTHPYGSPLSDISVENKQDVELAQLLLVAAEKVGNQQLERAMRLLENCQWISSNVGTPVQRVVFYFSEALRERINKEKGSLNNKPELIDACVKRNVDALMAVHKTLPFGEVLHFTAAQTILENIKNGTKVHLIDFSILTGLRWAAFMQAFTEETVAILFPFILKTLISKPTYLKNLMAMTKKIKPAIIFTTEVEANLNSPSFFTRFVDTLHYYGALFDSLEESMAGDDGNRMVIEAGTFRKGIHNVVATEGHQRLSRCVTINVWRAFLTRFGMQELELSTASLYQARLIVNKFPSGKSCTLGISKKGLLLGWKGTPLFSLSA